MNSASSEPCFRVRLSPKGAETEGPATCGLGHKLAVPGRSQPDGVFAEWDWYGPLFLYLLQLENLPSEFDCSSSKHDNAALV
jgi:hypothetical protein